MTGLCLCRSPHVYGFHKRRVGARIRRKRIRLVGGWEVRLSWHGG
jgi:hypothetical protein